MGNLWINLWKKFTKVGSVDKLWMKSLVYPILNVPFL